MHTDPIADLLTRIRNATRAHHTRVACPLSRTKEEICRVLTSAGYLGGFEVVGEGPKKTLEITLRPDRADLNLKRISTPGRHIYADAAHLPTVFRGLGVAVISTSRGLMTNREARAAKIGGEVLLEVW